MVEDRWGFKIGYSPDGLVGDDGLIEVKSRRAKIQLATIVADEVPLENMAQMQCGLLVSGREWIDYVSYCGGMPMYVKRVYPQEKWFDAITAAVTAFEEDVAGMIRVYTDATAGLHTTERTIEQEITI
jgi:predicted phage-related endonuclease